MNEDRIHDAMDYRYTRHMPTSPYYEPPDELDEEPEPEVFWCARCGDVHVEKRGDKCPECSTPEAAQEDAEFAAWLAQEARKA